MTMTEAHYLRLLKPLMRRAYADGVENIEELALTAARDVAESASFEAWERRPGSDFVVEAFDEGGNMVDSEVYRAYTESDALHMAKFGRGSLSVRINEARTAELSA